MSVEYSDGANGKNVIGTWASVYDYNPNATNYLTYCDKSSYWQDGWNGSTFKDGHFMEAYQFNPSKLSCSATASTSPTYLAQAASTSLGAYTYGSMCVRNKVYAINTTNMIAAYDNAISTIGKTNTAHYSTSTWNNYISALSTIEGYINNGVHVTSSTADPQNNVYKAERALKKAISLLSRTEVSLGNIFNQVTGATLTGPSKVYVGDEFEVTVKLQEGYTKSVPKLTVKSGSTTKTVTGTKTSTDTYTFKVTLTSETNNSITPADVKKNTYTVTVPTSGTGFTANTSGGTVTHGEEFNFRVAVKMYYTQNHPVVKANGSPLAYTSVSGGPDERYHDYTISNITSDITVTIDDVSPNKYSINYNCGNGTSKAADSATSIKSFETVNIKINVDPAYSQRTPAPTASHGTLKYISKSGNTYTYTLSNPASFYLDSAEVVCNPVEITVPDLDLNHYTVTIPQGAGYSLDATSKDVIHGNTTSFTVTLDSAHNQNAPVAKIDGKELSYTKNGDSYTFTTGAITDFKTVSIGNIKTNTYQYTLPTGTGFTVTDAAGMDCNSITHGNDYSFVVSVNKAYTQTTPTVTIASGKAVTLVSKADGADGSINYTYKVANVTKHDTVQVAEMSKNTYTAVLPSGTGYTAKTEDDLGNIVYGTPISFGVDLDKQYDRSNVVVKYNGSVLQPTAGVYKIDNITSDIPKGMITVEGVQLNNYYITLPLETETGFTIEVGEGQNAKSVRSGTDFDFKFFLDPAYSDSNPVIKYSADGGDHYSVLTKKDGKYEIKTVLSDCIVVVEGVKKNTYTVKFVDEKGDVLDEHKDVEYGSDVKFIGTEPTKATETVSNTTDEAGNNVLVERKYKFIGWSADTSYVTSNMDVTPIFEVTEVTTTTPVGGGESETVVTKKTANILFISDEVIVHKETVEKGQAFSGWTEVPVKTSSNPYETYEFLGWDTDKDGNVDYAADETAIADVQDDVTFVAVFKSNLPTQTVNFYSFDGSKLLYTASVKRGERANYGLSSIPSRTDKAYEYTFEGWSYEQNADETTVLDKIVVGENDITVYAAYSKEVIIYTYKYINDGVELQSGTYNFVDGKGTDYKYTGATPLRASSKSTDYTFDGWLATTPDRYSTEYIATYSESVREYDYALPATDGTYTIALDEAVGENIPYNGKLVFTVTLDEGYTQTAPVVKSNGTALEPTEVTDNSYVFTIVADGADADEIKAKLTNITVATAINHYDVAIGKADGADISSEGFNTEYNGEGTFTVTLKESHNRTAPVVAAAEGDRVVVTLVSAEGDVYTYKVSEIKSNATITVATEINKYNVVMKNWDGKEVVFEGVLEHGQTPTYTNPSKKTDKYGGYTFAGWDVNGDGVKDVDAIANVKNDINATAVYTCNHTHAEDPTGTDTAWVLASTDKADCEHDGVRHYKCSYPGCTQTKDWTIPARGHKMGEYTVTLAPTCTNDGSKIHYCENAETEDYAKCNHSATAVVPKLGHAYGEWKTIVAPTCTEKGKAERVCANDPSHKEYKDIDATGHHDSDEDYVCDDCGLDLGHCSKCICHKGNILSKVLRYICTLLTKTFHKPIKCCKDMDWYGDKISSIS
ncbi:MAG: hypothetical protein J6D79_02645 [Clostridia bacterium]|nr:hypothetical protein [Clostridia bacterium]